MIDEEHMMKMQEMKDMMSNMMSMMDEMMGGESEPEYRTKMKKANELTEKMSKRKMM